MADDEGAMGAAKGLSRDLAVAEEQRPPVRGPSSKAYVGNTAQS